MAEQSSDLQSHVSSAWRAGRWRVLVGLPLAILGFGILVDGAMGLAITRGAASVKVWLGGVAGLGALYFLGEWAGERIGARDKVDDPLPRRVFHLIALVALWASLTLATLFIVRLAK